MYKNILMSSPLNRQDSEIIMYQITYYKRLQKCITMATKSHN